MCGVIFDATHFREELKSLEAKISQPDFWNDQGKAQGVLRERKRADDQISAEAKLDAVVGDIETYINLAQEETDAEQRDDLVKDLDRELASAETYISELETRTLLSGESDHLNAIMTIKPGAGGTEAEDWGSVVVGMYLRWVERKGQEAEVVAEAEGE